MRSAVLKAFYKVLEADAALVAWTKHRIGAKYHPDARIFGVDTRLETLVLPCVAFGFLNGTPGSRDALKEWVVYADIYTDHVFDSVDGLDHLERIAQEYQTNLVTNGLKLNQVQVIDHEVIEQGDARVIQTRVNFRLRWV
jgi:hypothetical protein